MGMSSFKYDPSLQLDDRLGVMPYSIALDFDNTILTCAVVVPYQYARSDATRGGFLSGRPQ